MLQDLLVPLDQKAEMEIRYSDKYIVDLATVVKTLDSGIHGINHYLADKVIGFPNAYPLDTDLSGG